VYSAANTATAAGAVLPSNASTVKRAVEATSATPTHHPARVNRPYAAAL
jgi:hypothetical protein